ncbi:hypothetical protein NUW58_g515 [Xylaria curta]|uniref:Uncharacterized protein n=1 Tax=Xylaria curta TaxID=42375 RepID=A0ACC1PP11_9PEZI|nr:hypothetical protein NUW58_g515 [Xylaria curta]
MSLAVDSVEKLFESMADPEGSDHPDSADSAFRLSKALGEFVKDPPSPDPDYRYLLDHAQKALSGKAVSVACYFRQQLAQLAVQQPVQRKDKSCKARQLKYHRWLALGMKSERYPFPTRKPPGPPSTTRIVVLDNPTSCAACGKTGANMRCPNCTFQDERHVVLKTAYCNKKCHKDHCDTHKPVCEGRIVLYRAATLLEYIFMAIEDATYAYPLEKVYEQNGMIYLVGDNWVRAGMTGRPVFAPLPKHLVDSEDMYHALLLWGQSKELTLSLYHLIKYLFKSVCKSVDQAFVSPRNVIRPVCQLSLERALNISLYRHPVLKITLPSDEKYVVDLTGAQFGWKETLAPWATWVKLRTSNTAKEPFKPATGNLRSFVDSHVIESYQQEVRETVVKAIITELDVIVQSTPSPHSFGKVLKAHAKDYKKKEYEITAMVRQVIHKLVNNELHKNYYRLWLGAGPLYGIQIAQGNYEALKNIWMSVNEYDRIKQTGADMKKIWVDRLDGEYKQENPKEGD